MKYGCDRPAPEGYERVCLSDWHFNMERTTQECQCCGTVLTLSYPLDDDDLTTLLVHQLDCVGVPRDVMRRLRAVR